MKSGLLFLPLTICSTLLSQDVTGSNNFGNTRMRQFLPSTREIVIFAAVSISMAVLVSTMTSSSQHDLGLSFLAMPLFVFAAVLGLRKHWARTEADID